MADAVATYLVVSDDEVVWRTDNRERARGYADCYEEHVGEECVIASVGATTPKGGG